jgi:hypothetical protein
MGDEAGSLATGEGRGARSDSAERAGSGARFHSPDGGVLGRPALFGSLRGKAADGAAAPSTEGGGAGGAGAGSDATGGGRGVGSTGALGAAGAISAGAFGSGADGAPSAGGSVWARPFDALATITPISTQPNSRRIRAMLAEA